MREQREQAERDGQQQEDNGTFELSFKPTNADAKPITIKYSALGALPCLMPAVNLSELRNQLHTDNKAANKPHESNTPKSEHRTSQL